MQVYKTLLLSVFLLASGCTSKKPSEDELSSQDRPPLEKDLLSAPNCAADGPDCKQFNPDLK